MIIITALIGMFGISVALEGYGFRRTGFFTYSKAKKNYPARRMLDLTERLLFAIAGLLCVIPETKSDIIGISMIVILVAYQIFMKQLDAKKAKT